MKKLTILLISFLAMALAFAAQPRRSKSQVRTDRQRTSQQVKQTKQRITLNERQLRTCLNNLDELNAEIALQNKKIKATERSIDSIKAAAKAVNDTIAKISSDVDKLTESAKLSLREARKRRQSMSSAGMILSSKNFTQAAKRLHYLKELDRSLARKTLELKEKKELLAKKQEDLEGLRHKRSAALASLDKQRKKLISDQDEAKELVADLRAQGKALERELASRQKKAEELDNELDRIIEAEAEEARIAAEAEAKRLAEEAEAARLAAEAKAKAEAEAKAKAEAEAKAKNESKKQDKKKQDKKKKEDKKKQESKPASPVPSPEKAQAHAVEPKPDAPDKAKASSQGAAALSGTFAQNKGRLLFPASGDCRVVSQFGRSRHNDFTKVEVQNSGIDIQTPSGANARAVFDGTVSSIFYLKGFHNIVMVRHGEYITVYANVDKLSVRKGDAVKAGQTLGKIYADPDDGGRSILHFEVRKEREKLDPMLWVKQ
ncbi:MAG: peptidoglycan DD-metalloendopeptidase family protein [Clostridium sp.]|nr:peptidoglycan DD-metalloendopeptidase family protein [Clostridium sp.]